MSPTTPNTEELLGRSQAGDRQARGALLQRHRKRLRRMVALRLDRRLAARLDPSDIVQEALAEADRRLDDYARQRPLPFYPWLRQIAWDRLAQAHRRHVQAARRSVTHEGCGAECFQKCLEVLERRGVAPSQIAGVILEPLQGWATWPLPRDFARALVDWAKRHDILIAFDEIQAGCGRTGTFFACEHVGLVPDLLLLGKGLTSSLPASAVIGPRRLLDQAAPGEMSSTHGGNPVCAAAALANLEALEEEQLPQRAARTGKMVLAALQSLQYDFPEHVRSVHGPGLFISIHLMRPENGEPDVGLADAVALEAVRRGVLMFVTGRGMLKFTPPLGIDPEAALEAVDVLRDCIRCLVSPAPAEGRERSAATAAEIAAGNR
jgi:4-aminobutyrate aminotransferase-like enzyme